MDYKDMWEYLKIQVTLYEKTSYAGRGTDASGYSQGENDAFGKVLWLMEDIEEGSD